MRVRYGAVPHSSFGQVRENLAAEQGYPQSHTVSLATTRSGICPSE